MADRMPMMITTISSSTSVKPACRGLFERWRLARAEISRWLEFRREAMG